MVRHHRRRRVVKNKRIRNGLEGMAWSVDSLDHCATLARMISNDNLTGVQYRRLEGHLYHYEEHGTHYLVYLIVAHHDDCAFQMLLCDKAVCAAGGNPCAEELTGRLLKIHWDKYRGEHLRTQKKI